MGRNRWFEKLDKVIYLDQRNWSYSKVIQQHTGLMDEIRDLLLKQKS